MTRDTAQLMHITAGAGTEAVRWLAGIAVLRILLHVLQRLLGNVHKLPDQREVWEVSRIIIAKLSLDLIKFSVTGLDQLDSQFKLRG